MQKQNLIHYSDKPLGKLRRIKQPPQPDHKPRGLWVSVQGKDDWLHWCESERFDLHRLVNATQVVLKPDAEVLRLTNATQIEEFSDQYACGLEAVLPQYEPPPRFKSNNFLRWKEVAEKHQGIIIAPYCWALRMDQNTAWYYGWDCASGCIWDPAAIAQTKPLEWERSDGLSMKVGAK